MDSKTDKLYVKFLSMDTTEFDLKNLFSQAGTVIATKIIVDVDTGKQLDFGFVQMSSPEEAETAVTMCNGTKLKGHVLFVTLAGIKTATAS